MNKKNSEKHREKKSGDAVKPPVVIEESSDLPLDLSEKNSVKFSLGPQATADQLQPFTGLADAALRRLEHDNNPVTGRPWVPAAKRGMRLTEATLIGVREWRESRIKASDSRQETISYPTMESCEGATGITKTLQQLAKSRGCPAFRGPRIYLMDLVRWIFREAATGNVADWGKLNDELDAKLKQVELDTTLRSLITRDEVETLMGELAAICFGGLKRLKMEIPRDYEMRDKAYIKAGLEKSYSQIIAQATATLEKLKTENPPLIPAGQQEKGQ